MQDRSLLEVGEAVQSFALEDAFEVAKKRKALTIIYRQFEDRAVLYVLSKGKTVLLSPVIKPNETSVEALRESTLLPEFMLKPKEKIAVESVIRHVGQFVRDNYPEVSTLPINIFTSRGREGDAEFFASVRQNGSIRRL